MEESGTEGKMKGGERSERTIKTNENWRYKKNGTGQFGKYFQNTNSI